MSEVSTSAATQRGAHLGWRLAAIGYDLMPLVGIWMLVGVLAMVGLQLSTGSIDLVSTDAVSHHHWIYWDALRLALLAATAAYFIISWHRGGQTIGMRAWRLRVTDAAGGAPGWRALWLRYLVGAIGLLAGGLGFWWAWIDRDRLAWHDRASGTRMRRIDKPTRA